MPLLRMKLSGLYLRPVEFEVPAQALRGANGERQLTAT